jgi:hypothetical protein
VALTVFSYPPTVAGAAAELPETELAERTHRIPLASPFGHYQL